LACSNGHLAVARLLLEMGAEINAKDKEGTTPLDLAEKHKAIVQLLVGHGAESTV
jgi:ankyrin repeat protein